MIDNNAKISYFWTTGCKQNLDSTGALSSTCADAPTYVTESLDIDADVLLKNYDSTAAGGYTTVGKKLSANFSIPLYHDGSNNDT